MFVANISTNEIRYIACCLTSKRFAGRAALQARAAHDFKSLAELELALGINTVQARAFARDLEIEALRAKRKALKQSGKYVLAFRNPNNAINKYLVKVATAAIMSSQLRTTTHGHKMWVGICEQAGVTSKTFQMWPSDLGLPSSYGKYPVTCSEHQYEVTLEILSTEVRTLSQTAQAGILYLTPKMRVRNGKGTSLVTQNLVNGKWK